MYEIRPAERAQGRPRIRLVGSGTILREAPRWEATAGQRDRIRHPCGNPKQSYIESLLAREAWPVEAVSDLVHLVPDMIRPWVHTPMTVLGTDGFGRSESRAALRRCSEVDPERPAPTTQQRAGAAQDPPPFRQAHAPRKQDGTSRCA